MKKVITNVSIVLNIVLVVTAVFLYTTVVKKCHKQVEVNSDKVTKKIAILTPVTHPSLEKIEQGFKDALSADSSVNYRCDVYNANGDKKLLRAQAEEILQHDYDLIFTIASHPTQMIKELAEKKHVTTPIVFTAVDDPVRLGLVKTLQAPGGLMTGVYEEVDYAQQIAFLKTLKPSVKKILLPYNPVQGSGLERQRQAYEEICKQQGIALQSVEIYQTNEVYPKVAPLIEGNDAVLVLKDSTVVPGVDGLIKLCSMHHVTLLTSELESCDKGAAVCFGVREEAFGIQGAVLVRKIIQEHAKPGALACLTPGDHKLKINTKTMQQQGLSIDPGLLTLLKAVIVV